MLAENVQGLITISRPAYYLSTARASNTRADFQPCLETDPEYAAHMQGR